MKYLIISDSVIKNIIVADEAFAKETGALPYYDGAAIDKPYDPPSKPKPTPSEVRESAYNTEKIIEWAGNHITVTEAVTLWQYYAAEGSPNAEKLQELISSAKEQIREKFPDESGDAT